MPRLKGNTRTIIMEKALELFAVRGFEAVSIRAIADAVGIGNSALYKHFESKQAIFDALVAELKTRFLEQCSTITEDIRGLESVKDNCLRMFEYQTQNMWVVHFRQLLLIEKFRDPHMAQVYREFFVDTPLERQSRIFMQLQSKGLMRAGDPYVYAMELYSPFYLYHFVEHDYAELKEKYIQHIERFFEAYFIPEKKQEEDHV